MVVMSRSESGNNFNKYQTKAGKAHPLASEFLVRSFQWKVAAAEKS
jgi:hypothetical protein